MIPQENHKFKLENLKKENPFEVPENYFDSLNSRITDHVYANTRKEPVFAFSKLKPMLVLTGGFAGLALIIYISISFFLTKAGTNKNYPETEIASINEYSIVSGLDEATLIDNLYQETTPAEDSINHIENKEKIIDYLVKENIDISTIIDEISMIR